MAPGTNSPRLERVQCPHCGARFDVARVLGEDEAQRHREAAQAGSPTCEVERACPVCDRRSGFQVQVMGGDSSRPRVGLSLDPAEGIGLRERASSHAGSPALGTGPETVLSPSTQSCEIRSTSLWERSAERYHRGRMLLERKQYAEACECFRESAELDDQARDKRGQALALLELARALIDMGGDAREAAAALATASQAFEPDSWHAQQIAGLAARLAAPKPPGRRRQVAQASTGKSKPDRRRRELV